MNKLFITDLDGTLLDSNGKVSEKTKEIINALTNKGVSFAVATARTILSVSNILDGVNITAPSVLMNGVCTYDMAEGKYLHCHYIDPKATAEYVKAVSGRSDISPYIYTIRDNELCAYYENMDTEPAKGPALLWWFDSVLPVRTIAPAAWDRFPTEMALVLFARFAGQGIALGT